MYVQVHGSGGPRGWPEPGCRCASCQRARSAGPGRAPFRVVVDGALRLEGPHAAALAGDSLAGDSLAGGEPVPEVAVRTAGEPGGYRVARLAGGWDVTAPDGRRLLCADGQGPAPAVPPGTPSYDVALLDLLGDPAQLGRLRSQGAVTSGTVVAVTFADHRVVSERELRRRGHIWRVAVPRDGDTFRAPAPGAAPGPGAAPEPDAAPEPGGTPGRRQLPGGGRPGPYRVLVLGGARSGKSAEAEMRVAAEPAVMYVATAPPALPGDDPEWATRIAAHRGRRPPWWRTLESTDLPGALRQASGAVLVDSITAWLAAMMDECGSWDGAAGADSQLGQRIAGLVGAWRQTGAYAVAVSDETGLGIVPETPAGRLFRDQLGQLNQLLAAESDELVLVVAGRAMTVCD
ncbi:MAG: bifunctional adenosylcobinamide kinase/adenosylcobinamide-phosphate guanylyltransferase [Streptosporangiaceae bacterium]